jgi:FkbM family methyltransferase
MIETLENRHWDSFLLTPGSIVFDLGALRGLFSDKMADNGHKVIAFEPDPVGITTVRSRDNVTLVQKAVGYPAGIRDFYSFLPASGANGLYLNEFEEKVHPHTLIPVYVITLQDAVNTYGLPELVKMNIEGGEVEIIMNSSDDLLKSIRQFTISFHAFAGFITQEEEDACKQRLRDLGFEVTLFPEIEVTGPNDTLPADCMAIRR